MAFSPKIFGNFHPFSLGKWSIQFDLRIFFRWVGSTTNSVLGQTDISMVPNLESDLVTGRVFPLKWGLLRSGKPEQFIYWGGGAVCWFYVVCCRCVFSFLRGGKMWNDINMNPSSCFFDLGVKNTSSTGSCQAGIRCSPLERERLFELRSWRSNKNLQQFFFWKTQKLNLKMSDLINAFFCAPMVG